MERINRVTILALAVGLALSGAAADSEDAKSTGSAEQGQQQQTGYSPESPPVMIAAMPVFVPPNRGAPMARLGGATRSAGEDPLPRIEALVPEEPGWTLLERPALYWYLAEPTDVRIELVVLRLDPSETVLQTELPKPASAGVQRISLADHGLGLEPDTSYQWLVKLVPDPADRSYDRVVGGGIKRVAPSAELQRKLAAPDASRPHVLAEAGIWYDAVDELSLQIEAHPDDGTLWNQRAALFEQVGLPEIALESGAAPGFGRR